MGHVHAWRAVLLAPGQWLPEGPRLFFSDACVHVRATFFGSPSGVTAVFTVTVPLKVIGSTVMWPVFLYSIFAHVSRSFCAET